MACRIRYQGIEFEGDTVQETVDMFFAYLTLSSNPSQDSRELQLSKIEERLLQQNERFIKAWTLIVGAEGRFVTSAEIRSELSLPHPRVTGNVISGVFNVIKHLGYEPENFIRSERLTKGKVKTTRWCLVNP